jgi:hypothetical protein
MLQRRKSRLMDVRSKSIFEMDFPFVEGLNLGIPLFILYAILVFLVMVKMASTPERLANMQVHSS